MRPFLLALACYRHDHGIMYKADMMAIVTSNCMMMSGQHCIGIAVFALQCDVHVLQHHVAALHACQLTSSSSL